MEGKQGVAIQCVWSLSHVGGKCSRNLLYNTVLTAVNTVLCI